MHAAITVASASPPFHKENRKLKATETFFKVDHSKQDKKRLGFAGLMQFSPRNKTVTPPRVKKPSIVHTAVHARRALAAPFEHDTDAVNCLVCAQEAV